MQEIRHNSNGQVRYLYGTLAGILEFRALPTATTTIETLIVHVPACDGDQCAQPNYDCDAENPGDLLASWWAGDDTGIWAGLAAHAIARDVDTIPGPPGKPSHEQRTLIGRLRAEAHRMAVDPDYSTDRSSTMPRTAEKLCPGCNANLNARSVTPSTKQRGWCADCRPDHTTHLMLAGDFATFCGMLSHEIDGDPDATVNAYEPLFPGGSDTNCTDCARVLRRKRGN
ncbi:hypothetical protein AB0L22_09250 [Micromonospora haikouensis]|uniref:hypothetical protein n=1 Tax=Micromonospora haikouensis TaxID=686309 RepID=UPI00341483B0